MSCRLKSWSDILHCGCSSCRCLAQIHKRCEELNGPLFVCDVRQFDQGWAICHVDDLFVRPAPYPKFPSSTEAAAWVLECQSHCDVFASNWPTPLPANWDYAWTVESYP